VAVSDAPAARRCFDGAAPVAVASDLRGLRAALLDPAVRRVQLAADVQLGQQGSAGGPWGGGSSKAFLGPTSPLILGRSVEVRACSGGGGGGIVLDFRDAVGAVAVAGGATLRLSGDLLLRPCSGGGAACAGAWPALPAVALGEGSRLQLEVGW
jgi:hypothetical protein